MRKAAFTLAALVASISLGAAGKAQAPAPATVAQQNQPLYRVTMVPATIVTINYQHRMGSTEIGFEGSPIEPSATGSATVNGKEGRTQINAEFNKLDPATKFGPEYLTYVLWAVTPEGKVNNLGEIVLSGDTTKISVTTSLQTFGLIVTAEPYFAVSQPSNVVVLQNVVTAQTTGTIEQAPVNYELLGGGAYSYDTSTAAPSVNMNPKTPLEFYEAENAVQIAVNAGAQKYAPDALEKAQTSLTNAQMLESHHGDKKVIVQDSRDAVQNAADALPRRPRQRSAKRKLKLRRMLRRRRRNRRSSKRRRLIGMRRRLRRHKRRLRQHRPRLKRKRNSSVWRRSKHRMQRRRLKPRKLKRRRRP
jgi:hypothetical protein